MRRADLLRRWPVALVVAASGLAIVVHLPEALAFPHHRTIGDTDVYAEAPLSPAADRVLADAATRLSTAGIGGQGRQRLFLTGGGWRWRVLTLQAAGRSPYRARSANPSWSIAATLPPIACSTGASSPADDRCRA